MYFFNSSQTLYWCVNRPDGTSRPSFLVSSTIEMADVLNPVPVGVTSNVMHGNVTVKGMSNDVVNKYREKDAASIVV